MITSETVLASSRRQIGHSVSTALVLLFCVSALSGKTWKGCIHEVNRPYQDGLLLNPDFSLFFFRGLKFTEQTDLLAAIISLSLLGSTNPATFVVVFVCLK